MYDRDYVRKLEDEIELSSSNRFEGWRFSSGDAENVEPAHAEPASGSAEEPALRAVAVRAT